MPDNEDKEVVGVDDVVFAIRYAMLLGRGSNSESSARVKVDSLEEFVAIICKNFFIKDKSFKDGVEYELPNGIIFVIRYYTRSGGSPKDTLIVDVDSKEEKLSKDTVEPFIKRLVEENMPFLTRTGEGREVCTFECFRIN